MITFTIISPASEDDLNPGCGPLSVLTIQISFDPFDPHILLNCTISQLVSLLLKLTQNDPSSTAAAFNSSNGSMPPMNELELELNRVAQLFGDKLWGYFEFGEFLLSNISKAPSPCDSDHSIMSYDGIGSGHTSASSCWLGLKIELKRMKLLLDESQRSLRLMQTQFLSLCNHMGDVQNELAEHKQLLSGRTLPPLSPPSASLLRMSQAAALREDDSDLRSTNNISPLSYFLEEGAQARGGGSLANSDSGLRVVSIDDVHVSVDPLMRSISTDNTGVNPLDTDEKVSSSLPLIDPHSPSSSISPQQQMLPLDQLLGMCGSGSEVCSRISQALVEALQPQDAQLHYRNSVVALMKRHVRSALNCESYEVGLLDLHCFLAEDPLRVSAILCRNHSTKWHRILCDKVLSMSVDRIGKTAVEALGEGQASPLAEPDDNISLLGEHTIRNVTISSGKASTEVHCAVDAQGMQVQLVCNSRTEVCLLHLLQEIDGLVGREHLFKRSLLLIRAWWSNEAAQFVNTPVKHYLPDFALIIMVCAVFNLRHSLIKTPLQALGCFLSEYSAYDGSTQAISLQGIVPFKSPSSSTPNILPPQEHHLLSAAMLDRHWVLFCPCDGSSSEHHQANLEQQGSPTSSSSSSISSEEDNAPPPPPLAASVSAAAAAVNVSLVLPEDTFSRCELQQVDGGEGVEAEEESQNEAILFAASLSLYRKTCSRNINKFDRLNFNVIDPFTCSNVLVERMTHNRVLRLSKAFKGGAHQLSSFLSELLAGDPSHPTYRLFDPNSLPEVTVISTLLHAKIQSPLLQSAHINSIIKLAFPVIWSKYGGTLWRTDTWNAEALKTYPPQVLAQLAREKCSLDVGAESAELLSRHVHYSNFMVESIISRVSLLDLVVEILEHKGPLPIGEVGKALAELTCIAGLSLRLKEKYGGLKKFLEEYSPTIIIGNDHPFNPHVVLRCSLSADQQSMVDRGQFPTQAVIKMKKVTINSLKRIANSSSSTSAGTLLPGGSKVTAMPLAASSGYNNNQNNNISNSNLMFLPSGIPGTATPSSSSLSSHAKQLSSSQAMQLQQQQKASSSDPSSHSISPRSTSPRSVSPRFQGQVSGHQLQQSQQIKQALLHLQQEQQLQQEQGLHHFNFSQGQGGLQVAEDMDAVTGGIFYGGGGGGYMPMHSGQGQGTALHHRSVQQQQGQGHSSPRSKQSSPRSSFLYNNNSAGGSGVGGRGGGNTPHQLGAMNHAARMELQSLETDSSLEMGMQLGQMNEYEYENRAFSLMNHQQQMRQSMPVYYQPQQQEQLYSQQLLRGMNTHREQDMARDFAAAKGQQNNLFTPSLSNSYGFPFEQQQQSYAFNGSDGGYPLSSSQLSGNSFSFGLGGGSGSSMLSTDLGFGLPPVVSDSSSSAATSLMSGLREGTVEFPDRRNQRSNAPSSQHNFSNSSNKNLF